MLLPVSNIINVCYLCASQHYNCMGLQLDLDRLGTLSIYNLLQGRNVFFQLVVGILFLKLADLFVIGVDWPFRRLILFIKFVFSSWQRTCKLGIAWPLCYLTCSWYPVYFLKYNGLFLTRPLSKKLLLFISAEIYSFLQYCGECWRGCDWSCPWWPCSPCVHWGVQGVCPLQVSREQHVWSAQDQHWQGCDDWRWQITLFHQREAHLPFCRDFDLQRVHCHACWLHCEDQPGSSTW